MKTIKKLAISCLVLGAVFILYVYFAGVTLILDNRSGQPIHNVQVAYNRGIFQANSIKDTESIKKALGKIGEGSDFHVQWQDEAGSNLKANFNVYFSLSFGYTTVRIKMLPRGEALLYEGGREYRPTAESIRHNA